MNVLVNKFKPNMFSTQESKSKGNVFSGINNFNVSYEFMREVTSMKHNTAIFSKYQM